MNILISCGVLLLAFYTVLLMRTKYRLEEELEDTKMWLNFERQLKDEAELSASHLKPLMAKYIAENTRLLAQIEELQNNKY